MARSGPSNPGKCYLCDRLVEKRGMTRHLGKCLESEGEGTAEGRARSVPMLHLLIEASYAPEYWMHVAVHSSEQFFLLDSFLRRTWLECCGHMSAFRLKERRPRGVLSFLELDDFDEDDLMNAPLKQHVRVGSRLEYLYDFGSTTRLNLRVLAERHVSVDGRAEEEQSLRLLARNEPPDVRCSCSKPAERICCRCEEWLCERCFEAHPCDGDTWLPVVNSPRAGVCGYGG